MDAVTEKDEKSRNTGTQQGRNGNARQNEAHRPDAVFPG